jgi:hypothetical protein
LSLVKQSVVSEIPLVNESLSLWPAFFPFVVEFSAPGFHVTIFTGLQVTIELAIEVCFLFRSANPPFSHDEEVKESNDECVSVWKLTTDVVSWHQTKKKK